MKKLIVLLVCLLFVVPVMAGHYEDKGQSITDHPYIEVEPEVIENIENFWKSGLALDGFDVYEYDGKEFKTFGEVIEYITNKLECKHKNICLKPCEKDRANLKERRKENEKFKGLSLAERAKLEGISERSMRHLESAEGLTDAYMWARLGECEDKCETKYHCEEKK